MSKNTLVTNHLRRYIRRLTKNNYIVFYWIGVCINQSQVEKKISRFSNFQSFLLLNLNEKLKEKFFLLKLN